MSNLREDILTKLNSIFRKVFDDNRLNIHFTTTSNEIDRWDSISLANLTYCIELDFNIKIDFEDSLQWSNVGDICNYIESKIMNRS